MREHRWGSIKCIYIYYIPLPMDEFFGSGWKIIQLLTARCVLPNPVFNEIDDGQLAVEETVMYLIRIVGYLIL